jgi:ATP-dependent DNA helicase RecQ
MKSGQYHFVFASPESALKPKWRCMFLTEVWQRKMTLLVFDEALCISEWGKEFRLEYKEMAQLRSFFKSLLWH